MKTVTVEKDALIEKVRANREEHRATFLAAQEAFRERVIEELDRRLELARRGDRVELFIRLPEPEDHTDDYDTAIAMLEWEVDPVVELDYRSFERLVENKWEWRASFAANTESYVGD